MTVQPTEQCVQIFSDGDLRAGGRRRSGSALRTLASGSALSVAREPATSPRLAQEIAAVEPAIGLALQGDRKAAATRLTFSAFDQHGRLPQLG
jgi:hypothetical protein